MNGKWVDGVLFLTIANSNVKDNE